MADAGGAHWLPLAPGEFEHELALVLCLGLEDSERGALVAAAPVDEARARISSGQSDGPEEGIEGWQGDARQCWPRRRHGSRDASRNEQPETLAMVLRTGWVLYVFFADVASPPASESID